MARGSGDLLRAIKKSCSIEEVAPKRKHVRACIVYTWDHQSSKEFFHELKNSPFTNDEVQLFKMLILVHKVIQEGHGSALIEGIRNREWIKSLSRVHNSSSSYGKLISKYVRFLVMKLDFHAHHKGFRNGTFEYQEYVSLVTVNDLDRGYETILELMSLQDSVDEFSQFVFASIERGSNSECRIASLVPLISESYGIYKFIISMVKAIYSQLDGDGVLDMLHEKVNEQHLRLFEFYADCSSIKVLSTLITIPKLPRDAPSFEPEVDAVTSSSMHTNIRAASPAKRQPTPPVSNMREITPQVNRRPTLSAPPSRHAGFASSPAMVSAPDVALVPMLTANAFPQAAALTGGANLSGLAGGGNNIFMNTDTTMAQPVSTGTTNGFMAPVFTGGASANQTYMNANITGNTNPIMNSVFTGGTANTAYMNSSITGGANTFMTPSLTGGANNIMYPDLTGGLNTTFMNTATTGPTTTFINADTTGGVNNAFMNTNMSGSANTTFMNANITDGAHNAFMNNNISSGVNNSFMNPMSTNAQLMSNQTGIQTSASTPYLPSMQTNDMASNNLMQQVQEDQKLLQQYDRQVQKNEQDLSNVKQELSMKSAELKTVQDKYDTLSKLYTQLRQEHLRLLPRAQSSPELTLDFVLQGAINNLQVRPSEEAASKSATELATHMNNYIVSKADYNNVVYAATAFSSAISTLSAVYPQQDVAQRCAYQAQLFLNKLTSVNLASLNIEAKTDAVINANIEMQRTLQQL